MKKIILSLSVITAVAAGALGVTYSVFSDSEEIAGNTVSAATVSIGLGFEQIEVPKPIEGAGLMPGEWTDWHGVDVENNSTGPVKVSMYIKDLSGHQGVCNVTNLQVREGDDGEPTGDDLYNGPITDLVGEENAVEMIDPLLMEEMQQIVQRAQLDEEETTNEHQGKDCTWTEVFVAESVAGGDNGDNGDNGDDPLDEQRSSDEGRVLSNTQGTDWEEGETFSIEDQYGEEFTLDISENGDNIVFVVNTPFVVGGGDNSTALLFDADDDGTADFQFEFRGAVSDWNYQTTDAAGWNADTAPAGQTAVANASSTQFTVTIPAEDLDDTFRVAANATNNNSVVDGTHVGMSIPTHSDIFDADNDSTFTSSANYMTVMK